MIPLSVEEKFRLIALAHKEINALQERVKELELCQSTLNVEQTEANLVKRYENDDFLII